ncbi:MAG: translation elongation factor Ts [Nitrospira sp.]|nr:translation elongation factor Ts [Nitrospira sp.]MDE0403761.1 translation elongation factor Ts [Nitrospira sp.]MDE0486442.1 translation elongation factor Ts [Nitrospira sp.]
MGILVKELRGKTGAGILDCQNALKETGSDIEKAIDLLRQRGLAAAQKKAGRETKEGVVSSYIHAGSKIGVLVEVNCETDFVARNEEFQELVKDVALQIAAANPSYVKREQVPSEQVEREKAIYLAQAKELGKPEAAIDKIVQGKLEKFYQENCLLEQSFIKDPNVSITEILTQKIAKLGENISIARFTRYQLGQE